MIDIAYAAEGPRAKPFAPWHPWDRNFFFAICLVMVAGVVLGFGTDVVRHVTTNATPYPRIIHLHAAVFSSWLALLIVQVTLIRVGRRDVHRKLGFAMLFLAAAMLVVGPAAAYVADGERIDLKTFHPSIVFVQLTDMVAFAAMVTMGVLKRKDAAAHKRLMLLSTIYISDAGFLRVLRIFDVQIGMTFLDRWSAFYYGPVALILCMGIYDLITRKRLHLAYVAGASLLLLLQVVSVFAYLDPRLTPVVFTLLGHGS